MTCWWIGPRHDSHLIARRICAKDIEGSRADFALFDRMSRAIARLEELRTWLARLYFHRRDVSTRFGSLEIRIPAGVFRSDLGLSTKILLKSVLPIVKPADSILEVGTGCGLVALELARRCYSVVGVDINPDAIRATIDNARSNRISNTEFLRSDLLAGLRGHLLFDLIVFNPPGGSARYARTFLEAAFIDGKYEIITRFFSEVDGHLGKDGRIAIGYPAMKSPTLNRIASDNGFQFHSCIGRKKGVLASLQVNLYVRR